MGSCGGGSSGRDVNNKVKQLVDMSEKEWRECIVISIVWERLNK